VIVRLSALGTFETSPRDAWDVCFAEKTANGWPTGQTDAFDASRKSPS